MVNSQKKVLTVLHTSDWHLGHLLYGRRRYGESAAFLDWLTLLIEQENIDILLISGDIFDTGSPSNRSQEIYYRFLAKIAASGFRHIVITSGNHDSPSFLDAPSKLLTSLRVHVVGAAQENIEDEVLLLDGQDGTASAIVCAVPYLRERDLRSATATESLEEKEQEIRDGLRKHYDQVMEIARTRRENLRADIPILMMGHLFTAGARTSENENPRELLVGSLGHMPLRCLPRDPDYLALGHLHIPQRVAKSETMRYSGSPLAMSFSEAGQQKSLCLLQFNGHVPRVQLLPVPEFQPLVRISGNRATIFQALLELVQSGSRAWLEVNYTGEELIADLREQMDELLSTSAMEVLCLKDKRIFNQIIAQMKEAERLEDLDRIEVFKRCLDAHEVPEHQRPHLQHSYQEILVLLEEEDRLAD